MDSIRSEDTFQRTHRKKKRRNGKAACFCSRSFSDLMAGERDELVLVVLFDLGQILGGQRTRGLTRAPVHYVLSGVDLSPRELRLSLQPSV